MKERIGKARNFSIRHIGMMAVWVVMAGSLLFGVSEPSAIAGSFDDLPVQA